MRELLLLTIFTVACGGKSAPAPSNTSTTSTSGSAVTEPAKTASCPAGQFMANDGCLKECTDDKDCAGDEFCEQIRDSAEDGTTGPVLGSGCSKK